MKSKKSQGHVEMILSFVLFISFLLFIFAFLNPFSKSKEPDYIMEDIQRSILDNISSEVGIFTVFPNTTFGCYNLSTKITEDYGSNYRENVESGLKYTLYFSDLINPASMYKNAGCSELNYTLGVYIKEKLVSEDLVQEFNISYVSDYKGLKKSLGINKEFSLIVLDQDKNPIFTAIRKIPNNVEVESKEIPVRTIDSNAQIMERIILIKSW
jgi:hypothetical protein